MWGVAHHALVNFANRISRFLLGSSPVFPGRGGFRGNTRQVTICVGVLQAAHLIPKVWWTTSLVSWFRLGAPRKWEKMRRSATTMRCRKRKMRWWTKQPAFFSQIGCKECAPKWINVLHFGNVHWGNTSDLMDTTAWGKGSTGNSLQCHKPPILKAWYDGLWHWVYHGIPSPFLWEKQKPTRQWGLCCVSLHVLLLAADSFIPADSCGSVSSTNFAFHNMMRNCDSDLANGGELDYVTM